MAAHSPETTTRESEAPRATPSAPDVHAQTGRRSGRATTAMILGIVSIPAALIAILGVVLGVLAIVFGAIARGEIRRNGFTNSGQAMAGIICGSIGLVLGLINLIAGVMAAI
jgi:Domain of unknown function (DUF4190)